jgi:hypothetical protein
MDKPLSHVHVIAFDGISQMGRNVEVVGWCATFGKDTTDTTEAVLMVAGMELARFSQDNWGIPPEMPSDKVIIKHFDRLEVMLFDLIDGHRQQAPGGAYVTLLVRDE